MLEAFPSAVASAEASPTEKTCRVYRSVKRAGFSETRRLALQAQIGNGEEDDGGGVGERRGNGRAATSK